MNQRKYILKPSRHQFVPGDAAWHSNETLTDAEAEWYLQRYPHIRRLFINPKPAVNKRKRKRIGATAPESVKSQSNENLSTPN